MEYQTKLGGYFTQLLAGNPGAEDRVTYDEGLERHRHLAARFAELDAIQQQTLDARNTVDRLDAEAEDARLLWEDVLSCIDEELIGRSDLDLVMLERAIDGADRQAQGWLTRLYWPLSVSGRLRALDQAVSAVLRTATDLGVHLAGAPAKPLCLTIGKPPKTGRFVGLQRRR